MDIGAASALSLYSYQSALKTGSQGTSVSSTGNAQNAAVLQALTDAYSGTSSLSGLFPATDSLSWLAGSGALAPLMSAIYSASVANGNTALPNAELAMASTAIGGWGSAPASSLFSPNSSSGLDGFSSSVVNLSSSLALAAYSDAQNGFASATPLAAATQAASNLDPNQPSDIQAAIQAAQSSTLAATLNYLG